MSLKIRSLVVDDEANSRENIGILLDQFCPQIEVLGMAANITKAEELIREQQPALAFLDVQLGKETVFTLLKNLDKIDFEIIFITAHDHYALKAFEFMAVDYLLKPIEIPQLIRAVNSAAERINSKSLHFSLEQMMMQVEGFNRSRHKLALGTGKGYEMVYINNITYCLADGSYTHFYFQDGQTLVVSKNLKYYENLLSGYGFVRCHNTALVNLNFVKTLERTSGGALIMEDGKQLPVSKTKRQELEGKIKDTRRLI